MKLNDSPTSNWRIWNGGIVLDVSKEGFVLQRHLPLEDQTTIVFRLSMASIDRVEGDWGVVGGMKQGKRVGLRVTQLPVEIRKQVQIWAGSQPQTSPEQVQRQRPPLHRPEYRRQMKLDWSLPTGATWSSRPTNFERNAESAFGPKRSAVPSPETCPDFYPKPISEAGQIDAGLAELEGKRSRRSLLLSMFCSNLTKEESADPVSPKHPLTYAAFILMLVLGLCISIVGYVHKRGAGA